MAYKGYALIDASTNRVLDGNGDVLAGPPTYGCLLFDTVPIQTANSYTEVSGATIVSGTVVDTRTINQTYLQVQEDQKFDIQFTFTGITNNPAKCSFVGRYTGNPAHNIFIYIWNYDTTAWDRVTAAADDFASSATDVTLEFNLPNSVNYHSGGEAKLRIYHDSVAVSSHNMYIDYIDILQQTVPLPTAGTAVAMTGFTDGPSDNMTIDGGAGTITIDSDGDYLLGHYASFSGTGEETVTLFLYVNGAELVTLFKRKLNSSGDVGSASSDAIRTFSTNDVLSYRWCSNTPSSLISVIAMRVMATKVS
jgi:hypothetical protein